MTFGPEGPQFSEWGARVGAVTIGTEKLWPVHGVAGTPAASVMTSSATELRGMSMTLPQLHQSVDRPVREARGHISRRAFLRDCDERSPLTGLVTAMVPAVCLLAAIAWSNRPPRRLKRQAGGGPPATGAPCRPLLTTQTRTGAGRSQHYWRNRDEGPSVLRTDRPQWPRLHLLSTVRRHEPVGGDGP